MLGNCRVHRLPPCYVPTFPRTTLVMGDVIMGDVVSHVDLFAAPVILKIASLKGDVATFVTFQDHSRKCRLTNPSVSI